jgi:trimeric autotransporter adhesin
MNKPLVRKLLFATLFLSALSAKAQIVGGRTNEVFLKSDLVTPTGNLQDPWEITYGPDDSLWITESNPGSTPGYKVRKIHPVNGGDRVILDLTTFLDPASTPTNKWQKKFTPGDVVSPQPAGAIGTFRVPAFQGGLMGLAIHPEYMTNPAKRFVYLAYGHTYIRPTNVNPPLTTRGSEVIRGNVFVTWLVRFTYTNGQLRSPVAMCDTIPGSNDHNTGRIIIKPEGGTNYLYYAVGDMGSGQYDNLYRVIKSQWLNSYEGKILRFNLEPDADAAQGATNYNQWIPNDNPYNATLGVQSAVWSTGIRNNQGLDWGIVNGVERFYGASHGPFSDDEINLLERDRNYGHPLVIGYSADGNYNNAKAGPCGGTPCATNPSSLPLITNEAAAAAAISNYRDPIYSNYAVPAGNTSTPWSVQYIYNNVIEPAPGGNGQGALNRNNKWISEGYSGLGLYTNSIIPGWKNSLAIASLKWGRVFRMKLNAAGTGMVPIGTADTASYFQSTNRFRDVAFGPNGKDIYVAMDRGGTSSGPSTSSPIIPACPGCIQKYTFLGYNNVSGRSAIPSYIDVTTGTLNTCNPGNSITIDATNNNIWVPITGEDGNVLAEIKANGNNLGLVTSSFYQNGGGIRVRNSFRYLDRNITITPTVQPTSNVDIRLYISKAEYDALDADGASGINAPTDLRVLKNNDACGAAVASNTTSFTPNNPVINAQRADDFKQGANGYVLQATIPSFSSFYFGSANITLPLDLLSFTGELESNGAAFLQWQTEREINTDKFIVERSLNGVDFTSIATVNTKGNNNTNDVFNYSLIDAEASRQPVSVLYYRLKITDIDGSSKYSNIVTLSLKAVNARIVVTPNPVVAQARLDIKAVKAGTVQWTLTDNAGRVVLQNNVQAQQGNNTVYINTDKIAAGIYFVKVKGAGIDEQVKIVKVK